MHFEPSARSRHLTKRVGAFIRDHVLPVEQTIHRAARQGEDWTAWTVSPAIERLKARARSEGLWNLFLPDSELGAGLSVLEYAPIAEATGRSLIAPEIFNCSSPDTGNMELLWKFGSNAQKAEWLAPLLAGDIRSAFFMTEPDVASSDATNMAATAIVDGDSIVLDGRKWWSTGAGDPRCRVGIFMARTPDASRGRHEQHTMVLVPLPSPGVEVLRMLPVFGQYHGPGGHGDVRFSNVRVPLANVIGGPGRGFEIAQGRLGPGRIHHCMRCIGSAEAVLDLILARGTRRVAFGKPLLDLGGNRERLADARIAIEQARLLTLHAAWKIDSVGAAQAMTDISAIKVVAPKVLQDITDWAIQLHGGLGVCDDVPLTAFFAHARTLRIADGPDEVHKHVISRLEIARHKAKQ